MKKQNKTKIGVGSVVKAAVGESEDITREGRIRMMRNEVIVCVHDLVGKKRFLVKFEDGQKKVISYSFLVFLIRKRRLIWMIHYVILPRKNKVHC